MRIVNSLSHNLSALLQSQKGSALALIGVSMMAMTLAAGAAVDLSREQLAHIKLQSALDDAALACANVGGNQDTINNTATQYFYANFPAGYMHTNITSGPAPVTVSTDGITLSLAATATLPTTFMKLVGVHTLNLRANSQVTRTSKGMELVLVIDNTGSMNDPAGGSISKIQAAKTASTSLLNILYGNNDTAQNLWVGVVPFSQAVNVGTQHANWLDNTFAAKDYGPTADPVAKTCATALDGKKGAYSKYNNSVQGNTTLTGPLCIYSYPIPPATTSTWPSFSNGAWAGCVMSRSNGKNVPQYDITDDTPNTKLFPPYWYDYNIGTDNIWDSSTTITSGWQVVPGPTCPAGWTCVNNCVQWPSCPGTCKYPDCCPPGAEGCTNPITNPPNMCGKTYSCTVTNQTCGGCLKYAIQGFYSVSEDTRYTLAFSTYLGTAMGPNAFCPPEPILPLTQSKLKITAAINNMVAVGETQINLGLAWGWRLLSPKWRGLWDGDMAKTWTVNGVTSQLPFDYQPPNNITTTPPPVNMQKVLILMTDGDNNIDSVHYTAYGAPSQNQLVASECSGTNCTTGINELNKRTCNNNTSAACLSTSVCALMKAKGITIYTIALGSAVSTNAQNMLKNCATDSAHYFLAPTTNDLQTVFQAIGNALKSLHVIH